MLHIKILNKKGLKIDAYELQTIYRSMNYICHLFLLFAFYLGEKYVPILENFCQNNVLLAYQLKAHEAGNSKLLIDQ